jgi:hypothetical protein
VSPEQISILQTVALILDKIGSWPIGTLAAALVVGPWVLAFVLDRGQNKRFEAVRQMYANNVKLVEGYEKISADQQEMIILCTQAMQGLVENIRNNMFCPVVRQGSQQRDPGS